MISLEQLKKVLTKYNFIEFALLFGSFASAKSGFLSDVDIAIYITDDYEYVQIDDFILFVHEIKSQVK